MKNAFQRLCRNKAVIWVLLVLLGYVTYKMSGNLVAQEKESLDMADYSSERIHNVPNDPDHYELDPHQPDSSESTLLNRKPGDNVSESASASPVGALGWGSVSKFIP